MGYSIDAEYTIELLNEPKTYEYVAQRFFCTGFILATRVNEHALEAIMRSWREIDEITSDRLRFLFFIENETTLTGYPNTPYFTERGYRRYNQGFIGEAKNARFRLNVTPGAQRGGRYDGGRSEDWHPDQKVRKLAQTLGVASKLPCLIWSPHGSGELFVQPLANLDPQEIIRYIIEFCNQFYDDNFEIIGRISRIESQVEQACRGLYLSLKDFEKIIDLGDEAASLRDLMASLENCPAPGQEVQAYLGDYHAKAKRALKLAKGWSDPDLHQRLEASVRWSRYAQSSFAELQSGAAINVPQMVELVWEACGLVNTGTSLAPKFDPLHSLPSWRDILAVGCIFSELEREGALSSMPARPQILRWIEYVARLSDASNEEVSRNWQEKAGIVTAVTAFKLLCSARELEDCRSTAAFENLQARMIAFVRDCAHATVATLHIQVFYAARDRLSAVSEQMKRLNVGGEQGLAFAKEIKDRIPSMVGTIDDATRGLKWGSLGGLKRLPLPPTLPITFDLGSAPAHQFGELALLRSRVEQSLTPVGSVLEDLRKANSTEYEIVAERISANARHLIIVQAGATIQVADSIENTNIDSLQTGGVSISGTVGDIHGDVVGKSKNYR